MYGKTYSATSCLGFCCLWCLLGFMLFYGRFLEMLSSECYVMGGVRGVEKMRMTQGRGSFRASQKRGSCQMCGMLSDGVYEAMRKQERGHESGEL